MRADDEDSDLHRFRMDAARWVVPGQIAPVTDVTLRRAVGLLFRYVPLRAMAWFRFGSALQRRGVRFVPSWVQRRLLLKYGLELVPGASTGGGLYIAHPVGCVLVAQHIGRNVSVIAAVTLGMRNTAEWPRIGDDVFIGTGARVLGGITVGDGAQIGANAVVVRDVAPNTTVVGIPARPIA